MYLLHPSPDLRGSVVSVYVDESAHDRLGFVLSAFVCSSPDLERPVHDALTSVDLKPGFDEFKSGSLMQGNQKMRELRERLLRLVVERAKIAVLISPSGNKADLGHQLIKALESVITRNGVRFPTMRAYFDRGLFTSVAEGRNLSIKGCASRMTEMHFEQDSRSILGLQVADAVAHVVSQVLREQITRRFKEVDIGGEGTGYEEGTKTSLGWSLLMSIRYSFFVRPHLAGREPTSEELAMKPIVIPDENNLDAIVDAFQHPELIGWGVFLDDSVPSEVQVASEAVFSRLWLGCIH